ncbi:MAG TPA: hypothetical protein VFG11_03435 [Acidobacteriota bacterium]|nr:hypothetical protein [Acidobacteriota bacterium]
MSSKAWVGCGIALVVLLLVLIITAWLIGPKVVNFAKTGIAAEKERQKLIAEWRPPSENPADFFPESVAGYKRTNTDTSGPSEIKIELPANHATFADSQSQVDVYVYKANEMEKEGVFGRIKDRYESNKISGESRSWTTLGYRCGFSESKPRMQVQAWWVKGWLFVFSSQRQEDLDPFIQTYLKTLSPRPGSQTTRIFWDSQPLPTLCGSSTSFKSRRSQAIMRA